MAQLYNTIRSSINDVRIPTFLAAASVLVFAGVVIYVDDLFRRISVRFDGLADHVRSVSDKPLFAGTHAFRQVARNGNCEIWHRESASGQSRNESRCAEPTARPS
jgi:heat shock protein HspQ